MKTTNRSTFDLSVLKTAVVIGITILLTGCGGSSTDSDTPEFNVQTTSTQQHGEVLADGEGNVLYFFTPDVKGESKCEGDCIESWPSFYVANVEPGEGLDAENFGTITRPDGGNQTTYNGWPLYYFVGDEQPGDATGDGVNGVWYVAKPDNSLMIATEQLVGADEKNYIVDENGDYIEGEGSTTYFTDAEGRTLYIFAAADSTNTNNCTGDCEDAWPVFHVDIESLPSGINSDHIGEFTAHGDRQQLTYKGWPVYYFVNDTERGDNKGVSVGPYPGAWPVLQTDTEAAPGYESGDQ
jgi:predicted lipoprotein with Yx(FWY)xxD motif